MRIYLSTTTGLGLKELSINNAKHTLVSYVYRNCLTNANIGRIPHLLIDSGAFSAWTKGKSINLAEYIEWCLQIRNELKCECRIVNLDVIPGQLGSKTSKIDIAKSCLQGFKNYEQICKYIPDAIHVFHQHEDFAYLTEIQKTSQYFGISPANDLSMRIRMKWLDNVFSHLNKGIKTHSFGFTALEALKRFPFYSADSGSWNCGSMYGRMTEFDGLSLVTKHSSKMPRTANKMSFISSRKERSKMGIIAYMTIEKFITDLWTKRGVIWNDKKKLQFADKIDLINIDEVYPNRWNPNVLDEFYSGRLKGSIEKHGFIDPVTVRIRLEGGYEIIDGEQRLRQIQELGEKQIAVINLGELSDAKAQELTLQLRNRGEEDSIKLAELITELEDSIGIDELKADLPFPEEDIDNLLQLLDFDWDQYKKDDEAEDSEDDQWVDMKFRVPTDVVDIINSEIDRLMGILGTDKKKPEEVRRGLALEKMAVLSAQTPEESIN